MKPLRTAVTPDALLDALGDAPWPVWALLGALVATAGVAALVMRGRRRRRPRVTEDPAAAPAAVTPPWAQVQVGPAIGTADTVPPTPLLGTPVPFGPPAPPAPLPGPPRPPVAGPTEVLPPPRAWHEDLHPRREDRDDAPANPWFRVPVDAGRPVARWPQQQAVR